MTDGLINVTWHFTKSYQQGANDINISGMVVIILLFHLLQRANHYPIGLRGGFMQGFVRANMGAVCVALWFCLIIQWMPLVSSSLVLLVTSVICLTRRVKIYAVEIPIMIPLGYESCLFCQCVSVELLLYQHKASFFLGFYKQNKMHHFLCTTGFSTSKWKIIFSGLWFSAN